MGSFKTFNTDHGNNIYAILHYFSLQNIGLCIGTHRSDLITDILFVPLDSLVQKTLVRSRYSRLL